MSIGSSLLSGSAFDAELALALADGIELNMIIGDGLVILEVDSYCWRCAIVPELFALDN